MATQDDPSGKSRWELLMESMRYIAGIICYYDPDGVDLHFLFNDWKDELEIKDPRRVLNLLSKEVWFDQLGGGTFIANGLFRFSGRIWINTLSIESSSKPRLGTEENYPKLLIS